MRNILTLIASLFFIGAGAQNTKAYAKDSAWIHNAGRKIIELTSAAKEPGLTVSSLPFDSFNIKNVTADTSYIGVVIKNIPMSNYTTFEKVTLKKGTTISLTHYLNNHPALSFASDGVTLTCFIKRLRITEVDSVNKLTNSKELYRRLTFEAEGYLNKNNVFYPAARLDTVAVSLAGNKNDFSVLANILMVLAAKSALLDTQKIFSRKSYTPAELDKKYDERFNKPILQEQHLNAGVYKTFNEFIHNSPSVKEFEFNTGKAAYILYTHHNGNEWLPERSAFGFCDGKVIWINVKNSFRPLIRRSNTFEFLDDDEGLSFKGRHKSATFAQGGSPLATLGASAMATAMTNAMANDVSNTTLCQLDVEHGNFY